MTGTTVAGEAWHTLPGLDAAKALHVDYGSGLSADEAAARLAEIGPNRLDAAVAEPRAVAFVRRYRDPVQLVLVTAAVVSLALGEPLTGCLVLAVTLVNAALALHLEGRPSAAPATLRQQLARTARVRRDGRIQALPAEQLVPGDMVLIAAGDVVPADGRLVDSAALAIDECALTGERIPVTKAVAAIDDPQAPLGDRTGMAYMSTAVTGGSGELVVTATGMATEVGQIARQLERPRVAEPPPPWQAAAAWLLVPAGVALLAAVIAAAARGRDFAGVMTVAVAVAIAAVPGALPAAVTAILARGAELLARAGVTVKRLRGVVTLGSTSAIVATTPTLTTGRPTAVEIVARSGRHTVSGGAIMHVAGEGDGSLEPILLPLALVTDPTGGALTALAETGGLDVAATQAAHPRLAELPFDAPHKLTATFHGTPTAIACFVVGAAEQVLARSAGAPAVRERFAAESARLAGEGLRVFAVARRDLRPEAFDPGPEQLAAVDDLTLLALVGVGDEPRPRARDALAQARAAGIELRLVSADHPVTAAAAARALGLDAADVLARATAAQTERLVQALAVDGHVVAMAGNGVHDAPALQAADAGIATGAGSPVATEAAALTARDVGSVVRAVAIARTLGEGLAGAIRFHAGVVTGLILTFLGASVLQIAGGIALEPPQTLYLAFTVVLFQTVALGYGTPAVPAWAAAAAAVVGASATLIAMAVAEHDHGVATARTTGLVAFGLAVVTASLALSPARATAVATAASLVALLVVA